MRGVLTGVVACLALFLALAGCGGRSAELEELMDQNEAIVDLASQMTTTDQDDFEPYESDGDMVLGKPTGVYFFHSIAPGDGYSMDDVHAEVLAVVEADGWDMLRGTRVEGCCFSHPDRQYNSLRITIGEVGLEREERLSIEVEYLPDLSPPAED